MKFVTVTLGLMSSLCSMSFESLRYFSIMLRLNKTATLLVVNSNPLLSDQIKLIEISDLTLFKNQLMFETWALALAIILKMLLVLIGTITCFLNGLFMVMFNLGFCHMQVHSSRKLHPHSNVISKTYKPTFHGSHLSHNTSYGSAATLQVFRVIRRECRQTLARVRVSRTQIRQ